MSQPGDGRIGRTPDEIVSHVPSIALADVPAALAYYFDHLEEIQQEMRAERVLAEEFRRGHPSRRNPSAPLRMARSIR